MAELSPSGTVLRLLHDAGCCALVDAPSINDDASHYFVLSVGDLGFAFIKNRA
jgi:hypothetical protein